MVVNGTLNATLNATNVSFQPDVAMSFSQKLLSVHLPSVTDRVVGLVLAPRENPEMLWIVFPLVVSLIFMTMYFGRYRKEELGWNTAFGNALALLFVSVDLFKRISSDSSVFDLLSRGIVSSSLLVPTFMLGFALMLLVSNFFHILPKFLAFFISSALPINLLAYLGIVVVYTGFPFDVTTILAALVLLLILMIILYLLKHIVPRDWAELNEDLFEKAKTEMEKGETDESKISDNNS